VLLYPELEVSVLYWVGRGTAVAGGDTRGEGGYHGDSKERLCFPVAGHIAIPSESGWRSV